MKRLLNIMLVISLVLFIGMGVAVFVVYQRSSKVDTSLLEMNTATNKGSLSTKKGRADHPSIHLIFYRQAGQEKLSDVVVELLDETKNTLTYMSIPLETEIELSPNLYQRLSVIFPEVPQYFKLKYFGELFDKKKEYAYAQLVLDEVLSIDSSYYSVIESTQETFKEYQQAVYASCRGANETQIKQVIETEYEHIKSNLSKKKKGTYADKYVMVPRNAITFTDVKGEWHTNSFQVDLGEMSILMQALQ